ncbi:DUF2239 family protein [Phenylobacterium sp.]|jgi:hypothetical protein|uniref:DUF2239 family protein n=1 Tax=Phenylobacterium sp. TaxID=1871053 RepID=UPI002F3EF4FA
MQPPGDDDACTVFDGPRRIAAGPLERASVAARAALARGGQVLIFDDATGGVIDLDLRAAAPPARRPGRPKLGVESREVTLLPRHWAWLNGQPGGASAALRRLVEAARRESAGPDAARRAQEAAYRFVTTMAGDAPGYEEATRALFAKDRRRFSEMSEAWAPDVRDHARALAGRTFDAFEAVGS